MICDDAFAQHADTARAASAALAHRIAIGTPRNGELAYEDLIDPGSRAVVGAAEVDPAEVDRDDPCWFFYTSGSTGRPKAADRNTTTLNSSHYCASRLPPS